MPGAVPTASSAATPTQGLAPAAPSGNLHLVCEGTTVTNATVGTTSGYVTGTAGSAYGSSVTTAPVASTSTIQFRLVGSEAELNVPTALLPPINSNKGGWFKLRDLVVGETQITGKLRFNFLNSSPVRIDRITGILSWSGFQGACRAANPSQRAF